MKTFNTIINNYMCASEEMHYAPHMSVMLLALATVTCNATTRTTPAAAAVSQMSVLHKAVELTTPSVPDVIIETVKKAPAVINIDLDDSARSTRFRQLNTYYVGRNTSKQLDWEHVDLGANLKRMWQHKLANFDATPAVRKNIGTLVKRWEEEGVHSTTLPAFKLRVNKLVGDANAKLDYPALCEAYHLNSDRCVRLQYMAGNINGDMVVAYGMTELFPSRDGKVNKDHLEGMLYYAGEGYLNSIPALGDPLLSMGFYQFTSYAVRHDANGREGANKVAQFAPNGQGIAGSVMHLTNDQQHRAAFYFAIHNLALAVKNMTPGQYNVLKRQSPISRQDLTVFMATSHHAPMLARRYFYRWLESKAPSNKLHNYMQGRLVVYGNKSKSNLAAIKSV